MTTTGAVRQLRLCYFITAPKARIRNYFLDPNRKPGSRHRPVTCLNQIFMIIEMFTGYDRGIPGFFACKMSIIHI
jgi:hypothetical protein